MTDLVAKHSGPVEPDDRDPWQEVSEKERAEYEAWSEWVAEQMKKEEERGTK
jgi:hypothetical protein